jgi:hypothetical protein
MGPFAPQGLSDEREIDAEQDSREQATFFSDLQKGLRVNREGVHQCPGSGFPPSRE